MPCTSRSDALHEWFRCLARVVPMPCIPVWKSLPWGVDGVRTSRRWRSFDSQCKVTTSAESICSFLCALGCFEEKIVTQISHRLLWHTEITEITESAFGTGCALYLSPAEFFCPAEMKEIKESDFGTGCALIMYRSHRNHGNHRKCLRHRLRTESEA